MTVTTRLLAEKNGWISIVEVEKTTKSYIELRPVKEKRTRKVFLKEQGRVWELFLNVEDATKWIMEGRDEAAV
jgi:hypothetical protein